MTKSQLYKKFAVYYDKIYKNVDYTGESEFINWAVKEYKTSNGLDLLDVACGTGNHAQLLKNNFKVTGLDINEDMLEIAHQKVPEADFIKGDMKELDLDIMFDVVICIFSAIHYNKDYSELEGTIRNFYNHLTDGGVLIYDLSINSENWVDGLVNVDTVVEEDLKLARICQTKDQQRNIQCKFCFPY